MALKATKKMYLISPQQLSKMTRPEPSIRQTAEDDLNEKMSAVLNDPRLNSYEKAKRYEALMLRYLTLLKQSEKERHRVTLTLHPDVAQSQHSASSSDAPAADAPVDGADGGVAAASAPDPQSLLDEAASDVITNLPLHDRKNALYIMQKLAANDVRWSSRGEFIYKGSVVKGSHMIDLFKNLSQPNKKKKTQTMPKGWTSFLNTLSVLNIPVSMVKNPQAREQYRQLRMDGDGFEEKSPRQKRQKSPRWSTWD